MSLPITEAQFTETVIALAKLNGWMVAHFRPALDRGKWKTAMSGDVGFPDLVLARGGVVIFAELKSNVGKLRREQGHWLTELAGQGGHNLVAVWRPSDLERVKVLLR